MLKVTISKHELADEFTELWQNLNMEFSPNIAQSNTERIVATCPACGLLCDDVLVENKQSRLKVLNTNCPKSIQFFEQHLGENSPKINGKSATLSQAISHAAKILKSSKKPLFAGLSSDVKGFRATYNLTNKANGSLQHMNSQSLARNLAVLQNTGWQTTTLTEVKNRADVIVCIGTDIISHNPRFFERFVWLNKPDSDAMFTQANKRSIIYIGQNLNVNAGISPESKTPSLIDCKTTDLPEVTMALSALVAGKTLNINTIAGIKIDELLTVADQLKQAKYAVLIWVAKDLDFAHAELTIENITAMIASLNQNNASRTGRAAGLMLGGSDGDTTANNVNTWLSGLALVDHLNQHDDYIKHDCMIWVNSFDAEKLQPFSDKPLIVIGNSNTRFEQTPDVFIPVATPGLDCSGTLFRVDSSVVLPLKQVRKNDLPNLSEVIGEIKALL